MWTYIFMILLHSVGGKPLNFARCPNLSFLMLKYRFGWKSNSKKAPLKYWFKLLQFLLINFQYIISQILYQFPISFFILVNLFQYLQLITLLQIFMGSDSDSDQRKDKKIKKEKKEKKQKKQKKDKKQKHKKDKQQKAQQKEEKYSKPINQQIVPFRQYQQQIQQMPQQKTHISCRRCKQQSFSLKTRTCFKCGYPKEQRPMYFPVVKQLNVMDLIKQGKLVHNSYAPVLIQVIVNDRMGKKQGIKCCPADKIGDFKKLISAKIGTRPQKIRLQKANIIFKDHLTLDDYEIKDGMSLEMYYD